MPELPEVETTRRGIEPHISGQRVCNVLVRESRLRWPVPDDLSFCLRGQRINSLTRRGKYLLFSLDKGTLLVHLGMSGNLRIMPVNTPSMKHDHLDIELNNSKLLRFNDPRRFGSVLWTQEAPQEHKLLKNLGPEPLSDEFSGELLYDLSRCRSLAVKTYIMNSQVVVGVGNIYANESLFMAGILPARAAGKISRQRYDVLVEAIKTVLTAAIEQGGTTLKDFLGGDGKPGYFKQSLLVYGREGLPCAHCGRVLIDQRIAQRSTVFCKACQR